MHDGQRINLGPRETRAMIIDDVITLYRVFPHALLGGLIIAAGCAFLGFFVVIKRMAFVGITIAQLAVAGIAAGMFFGFPPLAGAAVITLSASFFLSRPVGTRGIPGDALLGILFVLAASTAILLVSKSGFGRHEVESLLYGDLILTSSEDMLLIGTLIVPAVVFAAIFFRPMLHTFFDRDAAILSGVRVRFWEIAFFLILGIVASVASKTAGALLTFGYLVIAPGTGLLMGRSIATVLAGALFSATASTLIGLWLSYRWDFPANQTIAVVACSIFAIAFASRRK
jgi:zinc transport system permease protein